MNISIKDAVLDDLKKLFDRSEDRDIFLEKAIKKINNGKTGKLEGKLHKFSKIHIGDYRVIIHKEKNEIVIMRVGNRKDIYKKLI